MTKRERKAREFIKGVAYAESQVLAAGLLAALRRCEYERRTYLGWFKFRSRAAAAMCVRDDILDAMAKAGADLGGMR